MRRRPYPEFMERPMNVSPYAEGLINDRTVLTSEGFQENLALSLKDTGISVKEMTARLDIGADREFLEQYWANEDAKAIARRGGLDLNSEKDFRAVTDILAATYGDIRQDLIEARATVHAQGRGVSDHSAPSAIGAAAGSVPQASVSAAAGAIEKAEAAQIGATVAHLTDTPGQNDQIEQDFAVVRRAGMPDDRAKTPCQNRGGC